MGRTKNSVRFLALYLCLVMTNSNVFSQQSQIGIFEGNTDVGEVKHKGSVSYHEMDEEYLLEGSGENMWFGRDEFHYLWKSVTGDFILRADVRFVGKGGDPYRKMGWIVRNSLGTDSPGVNAAIHGDGLTSLQYRSEKGGDTAELVFELRSPDVIQLERIGRDFYMSAAKFGEPFTRVHLEGPELNKEVFAGIYVCAHDPNALEKAIFSNVRIIKPFDENKQRYQEYLGSNMEILDIESGQRNVLFSSSHSLQAPNWTPDGRHLIYNSNGYMYRYDLQEKKVSVLETGFAVRNNNDHVLSFDGKQLAISHHDPEDNGESAIYTLPAEGSAEPKRITKKGVGPSYLHGWSADNKYLVFTGHRNGKYDVYRISLETGEEVQLTDTPGLDDGPEYSPDGAYIYFNSNRTGTMQIWRMRPDGSEQVQLTFDELNDWFPHISPDGKWIIFLSFGTDVDSGDHPFYKQVYLRLMPVGGGEPRILSYVYGGQGTINVPSWSPDSKRVAFVSNSGQ